MLAATQSETAVPPKIDFETRAPKMAENGQEIVSDDGPQSSAATSLGKEAENRPIESKISM
jgi:hypothetical protein